MPSAPHHRALEAMYQAAPINAFYKPTMDVDDGTAVIRIDLDAKYHHAAGAVHGSVYFKMLDDAAFFAANSLEDEVFVLTSSFTTYFTRPVVDGVFTARGHVVDQTRTQFVAEAVVENADGKIVGRGNGVFVRSKMKLSDQPGYRDVLSAAAATNR